MLISGIDFLDVLFQLTIFFLLSVVLYKILKENVVPLLYTQINQIKKQNQNLKEKDKLLVASKKRIEDQIESQDESFTSLEKKIKLWHSSVVSDNKACEDDAKLCFKRIEEKRKIQALNFDLLKTQQAVIPEAVMLAGEKIQELYGGEKSINLLSELIEKVGTK